MDENLLEQLHKFLSEAAKNTYAGNGVEVEPWRRGFKELEYRDGDWYYRDSYTGSFQSWGQEVVWHKDKPVWTALYGGGMAEKFHGDRDFAKQTVGFLKKALRQKESEFLRKTNNLKWRQGLIENTVSGHVMTEGKEETETCYYERSPTPWLLFPGQWGK